MRRVPLLLGVLVVLVAAGLAVTLTHPKNPSTLPSGLEVSIDAESTALYCTGLPYSPLRPGRVTFYNTAGAPRALAVSAVSSRGTKWNGAIELSAHETESIAPSALLHGVAGDYFGVAVQISGGGVVGEAVAPDGAVVPCTSVGATHWYATGFNTIVGSSATLSLYNPTATSAVFNASIFSAAGIATPESFQGVAVPPHAQRELDLGTEIVNTANVGVALDVLRGSLEVVGVEDSLGEVSFNEGVTEASPSAWFPDVTTVMNATAQLRIANPNVEPAEVSVAVSLAPYHIRPQSVTVPPLSTGLVTITPNPAIPAAGFASLTVSSSEPVVTALATGAGQWIALSSPVAPGNVFLVGNFAGRGFGAATVTNTSAHAVTLVISSLVPSSSKVAGAAGPITLAGGSSESLFAEIPSFSRSPTDAYLLISSKPTMVVSLVSPSAPQGVEVVAPLNGR